MNDLIPFPERADIINYSLRPCRNCMRFVASHADTDKCSNYEPLSIEETEQFFLECDRVGGVKMAPIGHYLMVMWRLKRLEV